MRILSEEGMVHISRLKPDGIIYDNIAIWGRLVAEKLCIPCFSSGTPYCYNDRMFQEYAEEFTALLSNGASSITQPLLPMLRMYNRVLHRRFPEFLEYTVTMNYAGSGDLNFLYTVPSFQLHPELIDTQKNRFTGILMDEDDFQEDILPYVSQTQKNIYIALGTIYNNKLLYRKCINALQNFDANIIMSIGMTNSIKDFGPLPEKWRVRNSFPQISLLRHVDVFISHGGINSLREAAYFGVPTVVLPQAGDHFLGAEDVKRTGTGCVLNSQSAEHEIVQSVLRCLNTYSIRKACNALSNEMQRAGGLEKVVAMIESVV
jgi:MGT family glycosyltransferase